MTDRAARLARRAAQPGPAGPEGNDHDRIAGDLADGDFRRRVGAVGVFRLGGVDCRPLDGHLAQQALGPAGRLAFDVRPGARQVPDRTWDANTANPDQRPMAKRPEGNDHDRQVEREDDGRTCGGRTV